MKKSKLFIIIISIIVAIPLIIVASISMPWLMIYGGIWLSPDPAKPQITSGEFPFEVVYKINGETFKINDVYVCEYAGIDIDEGVGKHVKWKSYIKSSNEEDLVLLKEKNEKIICTIGSPEYYMNDPEYYDTYAKEELVPNLVLIKDMGDLTTSHLLSEDEMKDYNIELISWKLSKPIENKFK